MSAQPISLSEARKAARRPGGDGPAPREPEAPALPRDCPVVALGKRQGMFHFFDFDGELRALTAQQIGQGPQIVALFGEGIGWCIEHFRQHDKDGNPTQWFNTRDVNRYLVAACAEEGLFRGDEPQRGIGVWRAEGQVAIHLGNQVRFPATGEKRRAGFRALGALWPALPRIQPPEDAATAEQAVTVEEAFSRWNWEQDGAATVMFGLWAAGMLGAAIRWRPHGLVVGPPGSGKTTLMEYYAAASPLALMWNDYTEAGLRQSLTGRAGPLILDEAEGDAEGAGKLQKVVELLRRTSSGEGAQTVRGSPGGQSQTFTVNCAALLGGILPPELLPQDASRITRLDLLPRAPGGAGLPAETDLAELRKLAPSLWGRALAGRERFADNLDALRRVLLARGCTPRLADQVGTILGAAAMMRMDQALTDKEAAVEADAFAWLAVTEAEQAADGGPESCWRHLLSSAADVTRHGERPTFRQLILEAMKADGDTARGLLVSHGLKLAPFPQRSVGGACLYVADKNPRLARVFEGTPWAGHRWKEDLKRLPGAHRPGTQWVVTKERCTVLPTPLLPRESEPVASLEELDRLAADHGLGPAWVLEAIRRGFTPAEAARVAAASKPAMS